jgi:hypothetical protein
VAFGPARAHRVTDDPDLRSGESVHSSPRCDLSTPNDTEQPSNNPEMLAKGGGG